MISEQWADAIFTVVLFSVGAFSGYVIGLKDAMRHYGSVGGQEENQGE